MRRSGAVVLEAALERYGSGEGGQGDRDDALTTVGKLSGCFRRFRLETASGNIFQVAFLSGLYVLLRHALLSQLGVWMGMVTGFSISFEI